MAKFLAKNPRNCLFVALVDERALGRVHQLLAAPEPLDFRLRCAAYLALEGHCAAGGARLVAQRADNFRGLASACGLELVVVAERCGKSCVRGCVRERR